MSPHVQHAFHDQDGETVGKLFCVSDNRMAAFGPLSGLYPGRAVAIVRNAADGDREVIISNWGFVLLLKGQAPKRVTNFRDDKLTSPFWSGSFKERRCLLPVTSFAEPKGKKPAIWHWFALNEERPLFAFAGIWRTYKGPLKKGGEKVEIDVHAFLTTTPNELVATIHPKRMPMMLTTNNEYETWLNGTPDEARVVVHSYPTDQMKIVQSSTERVELQGMNCEKGAVPKNDPFAFSRGA